MRSNRDLEPRLEQLAEHARRDELRDLRAVVVRFGDHVHHVGQRGQRHLPKRQLEFDHLVEQRAGQRFVRGHVHQQSFHPAHALRHLKDARQHALDHHRLALRAIGQGLLAQPGDALRVARVRPGVRANVVQTDLRLRADAARRNSTGRPA